MAERTKLIEDNKIELMCNVSPGGTGTQYGGYRLDFITQTLSQMESQLIVCRKCSGIMRDACSMSSGMAMVCATCGGDEVAQPVGAVRDMVHQLKCKCPLKHRGCGWVGIVAEVSNHLDQCPHLIIPCPYLRYGCEKVMKRSEIDQHREVSKEWHNELTSLLMTERIEQLESAVYILMQERKYLKLNGIVWKLNEKDAIKKKILEFDGKTRTTTAPHYHGGYGGNPPLDDEFYEARTYQQNISALAHTGLESNFYIGPKFIIDSFDSVYPQMCFDNTDDQLVSLCVTNNSSVNLKNIIQQQQQQQGGFGNMDKQFGFQQAYPMAGASLHHQQQQQQQVIPGTWEVVIVNNQDTEDHWKVEVGSVEVVGRVGFKLTDIPTAVLLDEKYYHHQTMEIRIRCKTELIV